MQMTAELPKSAACVVLILRFCQASPASSHMSFTENPSEIIRGAAPKMGKALNALKNRPNMHIGIHYGDQAREYTVVNNSNVLIGEDKHQKYKNLIQ